MFPSGTRCYFDQDTPPTGWTRDVTGTLDDRCLKIFVGTRGDGGSWTISGLTASLHNHTYSSNYAHTHSVSVSHGPHTYCGYTAGTSGWIYYWAYRNPSTPNSTSVAPSSSVGTTGVAAPATTSDADAGINSDASWRPKYRDIIIAVLGG